MLESIGNPTVLSLFGGIETFRVVLDNIGIVPKAYYSSEFDPYPIKVSSENYPDIVHIGDVTKVSYDGSIGRLSCANGEYEVPHVDILAGGPPCQDLSIAGKQSGIMCRNYEEYSYYKNRMEAGEFDGYVEIDGKQRGAFLVKDADGNATEELRVFRSELFWEFHRVLLETKPKMFIVENVYSMPKEARALMTENLFGVTPVLINSALVSAQNRKRLYWVGIRNSDGTYSTVNVPQPENRGILLKDVLEPIPLTDERWKPLLEKYVGKVVERLKSFCLTTGYQKASPQCRIDSKRTVVMCNVNPSGKGMNGNVFSTDAKSPTVTTNKGEGNKILGQYQLPHGTNPGGLRDSGKAQSVTANGEYVHNNQIVARFRGTDLHVHADQEKCQTLVSTMGTGGNNVPVIISEPYCLNPKVDGKQPSLADRIYHDEAKSTAVTTCFVTNVLAGRSINRRLDEEGKRADDDKSVPLTNVIEVNEDPGKSNTVSTFDKDNVAVGTDRIWYVWRKLTVREVARLQTFPDTFSFESVSASRAYKGFGNSWNVETVAHIALTMFKEYDETFADR